MDGKKSNTSTFQASKGAPKERQITANYWKGEKKPTRIYCDDEHHRFCQCEKVKTLADRKNYCNKSVMLQLHWNWSSHS